MSYLLGGEGFVGSAYARLFHSQGIEHKVITRTNYDSFKDTACDVLINANGNSRKYMANRDPLWEFDASVRSTAESLANFKAEKYVLLSSGDVYPDQSSPELTQEDLPIDVSRVSRYGLHKYLGEQLVQGAHRNWLVFRMGGFVGPGLKKNPVYDMLHNDPVWLAPGSQLQFISTNQAANIIFNIIKSDVRQQIINTGALGTIKLSQLHEKIGSKSVFQENAPLVKFELSLEKLQSLVKTPLTTSGDEMSLFLDSALKSN